MDRFNSTGLIPDDDWAKALNYGSFGRLTSSDDFGRWGFDASDSKYDDFDDEDEDMDEYEYEEPVTNFCKNKSEAWRPKGIFIDPWEIGPRMEDLPRQHYHKLAEVQKTSALLAKVKDTLDTVVRMGDNSSHETAAAKELLVSFRGAFGSAESDGPAREPKNRDFINLQRLQDSGSESDFDLDCFAQGKLMPASPTRNGGRMEIDVAVPGPSSSARPSPPQFDNAQTAFLNRLVGMMGGFDQRITKFTTEVDEMKGRVDERTEASGQEVIFCGEVKPPPAIPTITAHKKKKKKKKKKRGVSPSVAAPWTSVASWAPVSPTSSPPPLTSCSRAAQPPLGSASNEQRTWEPVVGREATQMFAAARAVPPPAAKKKKKKKKKKSKGVPRPQPQELRPSKTAAVSLTAAAGRENEFGRIMARAMSTVKVDKLGIHEIRPKRSATGGLVLEIRGAEAHEKAAALKAGLEKALRGTGVQLSCPQKYAELCIFGLTELATSKSIRKAVAAAGGCETADVTVGDLRRDNNGLFSAWARCPVWAAAKLVKKGQITVRFFVAKVVPLAQRPLQCHRCLEFGHAQDRCTSTVDRSTPCYRCGQMFHKAEGCLVAPRCRVCADLGVPANHTIGGPACNPPPRKMRTGELGSDVAPAQVIPGVLPPEAPTSSRKKKKGAKRARVRKSDVSLPSEPPKKRSKISTVARAPLLSTPKILPSVAAAGAAPDQAALKTSFPRTCALRNANTLTEMLSVALMQVAPGTSPSSTITVDTAAPQAKKQKLADAGDSVKPPAFVVQKDHSFMVTGVVPSVDAAPDVSLSVAAAGAAPGPATLQVSPPEASPATNAGTTDDTLALGQSPARKSPSRTAAIITAAPEAENLEVEDSSGAVKSSVLVVQKNALFTVAAAAPSVDAAPDVSLSVAVADAAPGPAALQVSPPEESPPTKAKTTCDMLGLRLEVLGATVVITAGLKPEKLGVEDGGCVVQPPPLVVQKDDEATVARTAPAVDAAPDVSLSVAVADAAPGPAALQVSPPEASPATNAGTTDDTLALGQSPARKSPSRTAAIITAAPEAENLEVEDSGSAVKPSALVVQKNALFTVAAAAPSVDAAPDVSLSIAVADAAPGPAALQVSPPEESPATNAKTTCDMLDLRQEVPGATVVITAGLKPEKLGVEDGECVVQPAPLVVQKDDEATVARTAPAVDAAPDVSLSVAVADAAPGPAALQVSPPEESPATNAKTTCDMLDLRQEVPGATVVITAGLKPEKLGVEDGECVVQPAPLVVQKDDEATVARTAPTGEADS